MKRPTVVLFIRIGRRNICIMIISKSTQTPFAIKLSELWFAWKGSDPILEIDRLQIKRGERVFIEGPSGSGKSTLLSLIAGVVTPQKGVVEVDGEPISALNGAARDRFRADHIGYIYQMFNLIPYLSVIENVTLPCRFSSRRREKATARSSSIKAEAMRLLKNLDLGGASITGKPATELSVGQQQRVAAARALIGAPEIIIADEPTSSLDNDLREAFIELLFHECDPAHSSLIFVSHDTALAGLFDRKIRLCDINHIRPINAKPESEKCLV
jgi:putative ABC transport system ATP-binding protein